MVYIRWSTYINYNILSIHSNNIMKKVKITYKNGFIQYKNVILQTEFKYVIKPKLEFAWLLECEGKKGSYDRARKQVEEKYGNYITTESPLHDAIATGILSLGKNQGGDHKIKVEFI